MGDSEPEPTESLDLLHLGLHISEGKIIRLGDWETEYRHANARGDE